MNKLKKRIGLLIAILLLALTTIAGAEQAGEQVTLQAANPVTAGEVNSLDKVQREKYAPKFWRIDAAEQQMLPINFRTTDDQVGSVDGIIPNTDGLKELKCSGSAQMSAGEMRVLVGNLAARTTGDVYIVDLRQEQHGYLDGNAASFYGKRNWGNIGKTREEIIRAEKAAMAAMPGEQIDLYKLDQGKKPVKPAEMEFTVENAQTEKEVAAEAGAKYFRITSTDHIWTVPENIDRFISFYKTLPKGAWLHFHCEAGKGRTTTYMVVYDILRNGATVSLEDITAREYRIGGIDLLNVKSANALQTGKKQSWKTVFEQERAKNIKLFYQYIRANPELTVSWSEWLQLHNMEKNK
ncbi:MAG: protein tyrosine phosphatase [Selenomonadaceae bacterium]